MSWGAEVVRIVDWDPDPAAQDVRAIRADPRAASKSHLDEAPAAAARVERLAGFRPADRILEGLLLQALPLQPVHQPADRASPAVKRAQAALRAEWWTTFGRGAHEGDVQFVLDARRIDTGIVLARNPPAGSRRGTARRAPRHSPRTWTGAGASSSRRLSS